jgi:hypothetical protein
MEAVLASHQVAIAQLAIEYCNALVEDTSARDALWGGSFTPANWNTAPNGLFPSAATENALIDPLLDRVIGEPGQELSTQSTRAIFRAELSELINGIPGDTSRNGLAATNGGSVARTAVIGKAVCSAVLGGAAMLVQ